MTKNTPMRSYTVDINGHRLTNYAVCLPFFGGTRHPTQTILELSATFDCPSS